MAETAGARKPVDVARSQPGSDRQRSLTLRNRQRLRRVDLRLLRRIVQALLRETWPDGSFDLAIYVVAAPEMTRLNETFLRHKGSTDVITFDYAEEQDRRLAVPLRAPAALQGQARRLSCPAARGDLRLPGRSGVPGSPLPHHLAERVGPLRRSRRAASARLR